MVMKAENGSDDEIEFNNVSTCRVICVHDDGGMMVKMIGHYM